MCKVLLPNGSIVDAYSVQAGCEKFVGLEGEVKRVCDSVKDIGSANRIVLHADGSIYAVGNLTSERVKSLLRRMLESGCLDCTSLELMTVSKTSEIKEGIPYFQRL